MGFGRRFPLVLIAAAMLVSGFRARADEILLCDDPGCGPGTCRKSYSRTTIQVDLPDLGAVAWDNCPGVMIGATLRHIRRETPYWSVELYTQPNFQGAVTRHDYSPSAWPLTFPAGSVASLALVGPAARFCEDVSCTTWTDIPDLQGGSDTGGALHAYPGRIARTNLAGGVGCCGLCEWRFRQEPAWATVVDLPAVGVHLSMSDGASGISRVLIRNGLIQLNYCLSPGFASCSGTSYRVGPYDVSLNSTWNDAISSFDLVQRRPVDLPADLDGHWPMTVTCTSGGTTFNQPGTPTSCTRHAECTSPYVCTTSGCRVAACYDAMLTGSYGHPKVLYRERISREVIGFDFTADYRASWSASTAQRALAYSEAVWAFLRGAGAYARDGVPPEAPPEHGYAHQVAELFVYLPERAGEPAWASDAGVFVPSRDLLMRSNRGQPSGYRWALEDLLHEYAHVVVGDHYLNAGGTPMRGVGFGEGLAVFQEKSVASYWFADEAFVHDFLLQDWPHQEYCRSSVVSNPAGCYGMKYSGLNEYSTNLLSYDSAHTLAYLGSQFMTPVSGTALNPDSYPYFDPSNPAAHLLKPLRYHQFFRQVAEDLYLNRNGDTNSQRKAWVQRATSQAAAGARPAGTPWKRCKQDDPSDCAYGAAGTAFWDSVDTPGSSAFSTAFRRWAKTHVERYPAAIRSQMHAKFELGGKRGIRTPGGNHQRTFAQVPFVLGTTSTPFTVIVTAQTTSRSAVLSARDSLRFYIDFDTVNHRAGNGVEGRMFDDSYSDGEQCYAFGHDYADGRGCRYFVADHWESDGNVADERATMRFIPSTAFPAFAGGAQGPHTLYIAAYNDPILYSVEVVKGLVTPTAASTALRGNYCAAAGDPAEADCQLDDPLDSRLVEAGPAVGNKIIQIVAATRRHDAELDLLARDPVTFLPVGKWHEGLHLGVQYTPPNADYAETKWFALQGYPMFNQAYLLRAERLAGGASDFWVRSHQQPFYHHVYTWDRPAGATVAARFYPVIRGLQMHGYMFDPSGSVFSLTVNSGGGGTPLNYYVFCEFLGGWSKLGEGETLSGNTVTWTGMTCDRVYALVGMAAPEDESPPNTEEGRGQVLDVYFQGG